MKQQELGRGWKAPYWPVVVAVPAVAWKVLEMAAERPYWLLERRRPFDAAPPAEAAVALVAAAVVEVVARPEPLKEACWPRVEVR